MVRVRDDRELHLYPELAHVPEEERAQIIRTAPTVGRARRTGLLTVTHTTREGKEQSSWERRFKCKIQGCTFKSKSSVRAYLRQLGIAIVDAHDTRIPAGNGRGALVCDVNQDIELEQLPAPQLMPPRPLSSWIAESTMQPLLRCEETDGTEGAMQDEAGARDNQSNGGEAVAGGAEGAFQGTTDGAEAAGGTEVTTEGERAPGRGATEGVEAVEGADGLLRFGRGTPLDGESESATVGAAKGAGAPESARGESAPAEQEMTLGFAHGNDSTGNASCQARSGTLDDMVTEPNDLTTWLALHQATVARSAKVTRQTCVRGMMIRNFVETLNFRIQYQIIKLAKNPEVQADLKGILDVIQSFQTDMGDEISI